jgi:hypothetical protein
VNDSNTPLTFEQVLESCDLHGPTGLHATTLGYDGDVALVLGHHPASRVHDIAAALAAAAKVPDDPEYFAGPYENRWLVEFCAVSLEPFGNAGVERLPAREHHELCGEASHQRGA